MANETPFTLEGTDRQSPTVDPTATLLVGSGIDASASGTLSIGATNATTINVGRAGQTVNVAGNLTVTGSSTSSTVVDILDRIIHLGVTTGNAPVPTLPVGISIDRGASAGVDRDMSSIIWDEAASRWKFALITQGDDLTVGAYQTAQALRFDAPTFGRADAGELALGGAATSIAATVSFAASALYAPTVGRIDAGALAFGGSATSIVASAPITFATNQLGTIQKREIAIGWSGSVVPGALLLDAVATSQILNLGAVLPANAMIVGVNIALATPFTGGGATAVLADVGTNGDDDAIGSNGDLFAAAVDGVVSAFSSGIAPNKLFVVAGAQLIVTVTSDVNVSALTAGDATVTVSFVQLP